MTVPDLLAGLRLTGHFLTRDILTGRAAELLAARSRLVELVAALDDPALTPSSC